MPPDTRDFVEEDTAFRLESGDKFVTFKCANRDDLPRVAALAAVVLWDALHPTDVPMRAEATKRLWREMELANAT